MFTGCTSLAYLNLYNYNDNFTPNINNIFYETSNNLLIVINKESNLDKIISELSSFKCIFNNSPMIIEDNKRRIIYDKRLCIIGCQIDEIFKYEYDNFCYRKCPSGTHFLKDNLFMPRK